MEYRLNKTQFLRGITDNPETGFETMKGIDIYSDLGFMTPTTTGIRVSPSGITGTVTNIIVDNQSLKGYTLARIVQAQKVMTYDVDGATFATINTTPTASQFDGGSEVFGNVFYVIKPANGTVGKLHIAAGGQLREWSASLGTVATGGSWYELCMHRSMLYGCSYDRIFKISDSATLTTAALLLESFTTAVSMCRYGEYLVVGAIKGKYQKNYATYGVGAGTYQSKLYFWDGVATSWEKWLNTDLNGVILKVLNDRGILKIWVQRETDRIDILYWDGNSLQPLQTIIPNRGTNIVPPSPSAFDIKNNLVYFGAGYANQGGFSIYAYGTGDTRVAPALSNPYAVDFSGATTLKSIDSLKWIKDNELWAGITTMQDTHYLYKFGTATTEYSFTIKTPTFSFPRRQMVNSIRVNCKPMASGDTLYIKRKIDHDHWDTSTWAYGGYANNSSTDPCSIYFPTQQFPARSLQLQLWQGEADNIRIKEIIVKTEDIDEV